MLFSSNRSVLDNIKEKIYHCQLSKHTSSTIRSRKIDSDSYRWENKESDTFRRLQQHS